MVLHVVNSMKDLSFTAVTNVECDKSRNAIPARLNSKGIQQSTSLKTRTAHIQADYTGHVVPWLLTFGRKPDNLKMGCLIASLLVLQR